MLQIILIKDNTKFRTFTPGKILMPVRHTEVDVEFFGSSQSKRVAKFDVDQ